AALTTALKGAIERNADIGAKRVEGHAFNDDAARIKAYEDAGFRRGSAGAGVMTLTWGEEVTPEELQVYAEQDKAHEQMVLGMASSVAKDLKFPADKIQLGSEGEAAQNFVLNGKQFKAAGLAYTRAADPAMQGTIKLFPRRIWDEKNAQGITAHEIEHIKFQNALDRHQQERDAVMKEPGPPPNPNSEHHWERVGGTDAVMKPDGTLRAPYDQKYPVYQLIEQTLHTIPTDDFAAGDGVSSYSKEYWEQFDKDRTAVNLRSAHHETLAEMARAKYQSGKFPEHQGATPAARKQNGKIWRNLYRAVDKVHQL
ncbi:MAG TPA: hypothetical protein VGH47_08060, partial [Xanthobacteraceae bacterium]